MSLLEIIGLLLAVIIGFLLWAVLALRRRTRVAHITEWSIGLYSGASPLSLRPDTRAVNPVLTAADVTDVKAQFVADPFIFKSGVTWYLFCEVYNTLLNRGQIGLASSADGRRFTYERIVLSEPFHVSYPFVFAEGDAVYMVPESAAAGAVRLYRAAPFPYSWTLAGELVKGSFCDSTLVRHNKKWWLFTCYEPAQRQGRHKDLHLFFADALLGPYTEHPKSPIVKNNAHWARPGGRLWVEGERIVRFAQDCRPTYGKSLNALEILALTETDFQEKALRSNPILTASGKGWNRHGMHHADAHKLEDGTFLACVDGYRKYFTVRVEY
ncbi:MAG: hypothetical protein PHC61_10200 [Chitinivibrionales bacterium]|nr:hypothetical protein [Chitinivibrionales bacterium]